MTGAKSEAKQEKVLPLSSSAIPPSASSSVDRDPTRQRAKCARCAEDEGDITVYHVVRTCYDNASPRLNSKLLI